LAIFTRWTSRLPKECARREKHQVEQRQVSQKPLKNLAQVLLDSRFAGSDLDLEREKDYGRTVDL
jgi:hypothetical protein